MENLEGEETGVTLTFFFFFSFLESKMLREKRHVEIEGKPGGGEQGGGGEGVREGAKQQEGCTAWKRKTGGKKEKKSGRLLLLRPRHYLRTINS